MRDPVTHCDTDLHDFIKINATSLTRILNKSDRMNVRAVLTKHSAVTRKYCLLFSCFTEIKNRFFFCVRLLSDAIVSKHRETKQHQPSTVPDARFSFTPKNKNQDKDHCQTHF